MKRIFRGFIVICVALLVAGCPNLADGDWGVSDVHVIKGNDSCSGLTCAGFNYYLKNNTSRDLRVTYTRKYNGGEDGIHQFTKTVKANKKRFLSCEKVIITPSDVCDGIVSYTVDSVEKSAALYINDVQKINIAGEIPKASPLPVKNKVSPEQCWKECTDSFSDENTGACISINNSSSLSKSVDGLHWLAGQIQNKLNYTIPKETIMKNFGVEADPCNRSDTSIQSTKLVNKGEACRLSASVPIAGPPETKIDIDMPERLVGEVNLDGQGFEITFPIKAESIDLIFNDDKFNYDDDYGGFVRHVKKYDKHLVFTTTRGCIAVESNS